MTAPPPFPVRTASRTDASQITSAEDSSSAYTDASALLEHARIIAIQTAGKAHGVSPLVLGAVALAGFVLCAGFIAAAYVCCRRNLRSTRTDKPTKVRVKKVKYTRQRTMATDGVPTTGRCVKTANENEAARDDGDDDEDESSEEEAEAEEAGANAQAQKSTPSRENGICNPPPPAKSVDDLLAKITSLLPPEAGSGESTASLSLDLHIAR